VCLRPVSMRGGGKRRRGQKVSGDAGPEGHPPCAVGAEPLLIPQVEESRAPDKG
jgi:hypothetical protein